MYSKTGKSFLAAAALALILIAMPPQAHATSLGISFEGNVFGCSDVGSNGPVSFNFTGSGQASGSNTIFVVDFGSSLGSVSIPIPTESVQALIDAVSSAGGSLSVGIGPEPLGAPGCDIEGTLTLSVDGGSPGSLSASAPSNLATTLSSLITGTRADIASIGNRIKGVMRGQGTGIQTSSNGITISGMSAGSADGTRFGAWAGYSYTDTRNNFVTTAFDSNRHGMLFGVDMMHGNNLLLGVAVGLDRTSVRTRFNAGEQDLTGVTLMPYVGLLLNDWLSLDAAFGYGDTQTDQFRAGVGGAQISSDVESSRVFGSINATATHSVDRLLLSARTGLLYATQKDDSFIESNGTVIPQQRSNLGRFLLGGEVAYSAGAWEPYVSGTFEYDFTSTSSAFAPGVLQPRRDDSDLLIAAGLRYFGRNNLSGSLEYSRVIGRRYLDEDSFSANARWRF